MDEPLDIHAPRTEVHDQANLPAPGAQIIQTLFAMILVEIRACLQFDYDTLFHHQVGDKGAHRLALVGDAGSP